MNDRPPFAPDRASSAPVEVASLAGLRRALDDPGYAAVCFVGPSGGARADLLHALADALRGRYRLVYLRGSALPPGGFWMRVADALELASGYDARRRVLGLAGELSRSGQALLLVLDDAQALPADTLYAVLATARSQPGFRAVLAHGAGERLAGPLPEDVALVLSEATPPLPASEAAVQGESATEAREATPSEPRSAVRATAPAPLGATGNGAPIEPAAPAPVPALDAAAPTPWSVGPESGGAREPARANAAPPPWEPDFDSPAPSRRRAARERLRRERRRRFAWGASGLAFGLLLAASVDLERWRGLAERALGGVGEVAPPRPAPEPAPLAEAAPPTRVARGAEPPPRTEESSDAIATPSAVPRNAPADDAAPAPTAGDGGAAGAPTVAAAPPPSTPSGVDPPPLGEAPAPDATARVDAAPRRTAPAPDVAAAPPPSAPASPPPEAPAPDERSARPSAPSRPTSPEVTRPAPRRRGPIALGALEIAADSPVLIEIDGQPFGPTPLSGIRLPRGEHRILAHFPDGSMAQKTVVLDEQDLAVEFQVR